MNQLLLLHYQNNFIMKKIILAVLAFGLFLNSFAQSEYKKASTLGVNFVFCDFRTPADLRTNGLASLIRSKDWSKTSRMSAGIGVSFMEGINNQLDYTVTASAFGVDYPVPNKASSGSVKLLVDVAAVVNLKLISDKYVISPYLSLGAGASKYGKYYSAFIPAGVGLQFNLFDETFIQLNSQYRMPVTENAAYQIFHSIGFSGVIGKKKVTTTATLPAAPTK